MDLSDLGINLRGRPTQPSAPPVVVRPLRVEDLDLLIVERAPSSRPPLTLERITDRHHMLARNLAAGMPAWEASVISGYHPSYISQLTTCPTFQNLVKHYRDNVDALYADVHQHHVGMTVDSAVILRERMENDPDSLSTGQLIEINKLGADRTGHGPQTSSTQVNIHVNTAAKLETARKRVEAHRMKTIEAEVVKEDDAA